MYKICFYVPESHKEAVKNAMFAAGAGRIGNYDCCAWEAAGTGQFRPLKGSNPYSGQLDEIQKEPEYQVECVCEDGCIKAVLNALLATHPYEEPAYNTWKVASLRDFDD